MLDDWTTALARELGLDDAVDTALLLGLARDAAHRVEADRQSHSPAKTGTT